MNTKLLDEIISVFIYFKSELRGADMEKYQTAAQLTNIYFTQKYLRPEDETRAV